MQKLIYSIAFSSFWHTGSGLSSGVGANTLVIKDDNGLPFIPGRTLKGLLRDAAENLHEINPDRIPADFLERIFGRSDEERSTGKPEQISGYDAGGCFFGNAGLSEELQKKIPDQRKPLLFTTLASTAIDKKGQAEDHTLRHLEATIPLTLYAYIDRFPNSPADLNRLQDCFKWIKRIGYNRNRGLGRCQFTLQNQGS